MFEEFKNWILNSMKSLVIIYLDKRSFACRFRFVLLKDYKNYISERITVNKKSL